MQLFKSQSDSVLYYWVERGRVMCASGKGYEMESAFELDTFNDAIERGYFQPFEDKEQNPFWFWNKMKSGSLFL